MKLLKKIFTLSLYVALLNGSAFALYKGYSNLYHKAYPVKYEAYVQQSTEKYGVDEALVYAVIYSESAFDPQAQSNAGALGLMQIMPETYDWLQTHIPQENATTDKLLEPQTNIEYGVYMLSYLIERYGDEHTAVCAYNAGMGTVDSWLKQSSFSSDGKTLFAIPYPETSEYVEKVFSVKKTYQNLYY